ncbi:MAG: SDR family NAD(P)-dependent oxidoreductase, partial [Candidatus Binatia bacterium]
LLTLYRKPPPRTSERGRARRRNFVIHKVICYLRRMADLVGKIVMITGGSGGLGRALAHAFVDRGSRVILTARDETKLQIAAKQLGQDSARVLALPCDIRRRDQVENLAQAVRARWGAVQVLINNAGVAQAVNFLQMPDSVWDDTLQVNLTGAYYCCKVFLPAMIDAKWGRIINIASTAAKVGYPHVTAYTSSKHGLLGLTRSLALETARLGTTVNAICPGYIDGELTHENAEKMAEKTGKSVQEILALFASSAPQNRLIEAAEVASVALMLASDRAGGMTGQAINVDGGAVMV